MSSFHFISGLPRAGFTLLSAILLQNPRFHAGMSSPVGALFSSMLGQAPEKVLRLVYGFIGEPWYPHDFDSLSYDAPAFDQALGLSGLHRVRPKARAESRRTILPPDLFAQYSELSFWNDGAGSAAYVIRPGNNESVGALR